MAKTKPRTSVYIMPESHRVKIQNSNILNVLIEHVQGTREMSATQVAAGLGLLKKCLPDLSAVTLTGADGGAIQITRIEIVAPSQLSYEPASDDDRAD